MVAPTLTKPQILLTWREVPGTSATGKKREIGDSPLVSQSHLGPALADECPEGYVARLWKCNGDGQIPDFWHVTLPGPYRVHATG